MSSASGLVKRALIEVLAGPAHAGAQRAPGVHRRRLGTAMPKNVAHDLCGLALLDLARRVRMTEQMRSEIAFTNPCPLGVQGDR